MVWEHLVSFLFLKCPQKQSQGMQCLMFRGEGKLLDPPSCMCLCKHTSTATGLVAPHSNFRPWNTTWLSNYAIAKYNNESSGIATLESSSLSVWDVNARKDNWCEFTDMYKNFSASRYTSVVVSSMSQTDRLSFLEWYLGLVRNSGGFQLLRSGNQWSSHTTQSKAHWGADRTYQ